MRALALLSVLAILSPFVAGCSDDGDSSSGGGLNPGDVPADEGDDEPDELAGTLQAHNDARAEEGLDELVWDADLAQIAKDWGEQCQGGALLDHNEGRSDNYPSYVGENIYASTGMASGPDAVRSWMDEVVDYDKDSCECSGVCGHYTQVMWAETTRVGCAIVTCDNLRYPNNVVCNYAIGGNSGGCAF